MDQKTNEVCKTLICKLLLSFWHCLIRASVSPESQLHLPSEAHEEQVQINRGDATLEEGEQQSDIQICRVFLIRCVLTALCYPTGLFLTKIPPRPTRAGQSEGELLFHSSRNAAMCLYPCLSSSRVVWESVRIIIAIIIICAGSEMYFPVCVAGVSWWLWHAPVLHWRREVINKRITGTIELPSSNNIIIQQHDTYIKMYICKQRNIENIEDNSELN